MTAVVKNQLSSWALTALQLTQGSLQTSPLVKKICQTIDSVTATATAADQENVKPVITRSEVTNHCSYESCWVVINNRVYDITRFLRMHPGGEDIILEHAGRDATSVFIDKGHSGDAYDMLADYYVADVAPADWFPERLRT